MSLNKVCAISITINGSIERKKDIKKEIETIKSPTD